MKPDLSAVPPLHHNLATRAVVGDGLTRTAAMFGDRTAVIDASGQVTYRELDRASDALARALLAGGLGRQQPVGMVTLNSWRMLAGYFACAKAALVAVPVNVALTPADIAWILRDAGATVVIVDQGLAGLLGEFLTAPPAGLRLIVIGDDPEAALPGRGAEAWDDMAAGDPGAPEVLIDDRDIVQCLYTSGTTANPKGVLTAHVSVLIGAMTNAMQIGHRWGADPSVLLDVLPLFHTTGLNTLVLPVLLTGGTVVVQAGFDPAAVLDAIERHAVTHVMFLPMMYRALVAARGDAGPLPGVRTAVYAMAAMPTDLLAQVAVLFPSAAVILGSGQTEVVPATVLQWPEHQHTKPGSWGPAAPTVATAVLGPDDAPVAPEVSGEIAYRGPHVMAGYWNAAEANADAFAGGWFHSGDIGRLDDEHVVWFTDRLKDVIKTGGENVSSVDVESVIAAAPGVAECTIVGIADEHWGEAVCAVVVAAEPAAADTLPAAVLAHARTHLAGFQVPKTVLVVDELPKTATGKVRKHLVRDRLTGP